MRSTFRGATAMAATIILLTSCAPTGRPANPPASPPSAGPAASYRFTLDSECGERALIGTYFVTVERGVVTAAEPVGEGAWRPETAEELSWVPTLAGLLARAQRKGAAAPSEFHVDPDTGIPTEIAFEGDPRAIDDEECYRVSDYRPDVGAGE